MTRAGAILSLLVLFTGCATSPQQTLPADPDAAWARRQSILHQQQKWALTGKLAVTANQEGWFAGLHWQQDGGHFQIDLLDSFGRVVARIKGDEVRVALIQSDGATTTAANAQSLMQKLYGWALPLSGLRYWVLGIPAPGPGSQDGTGHKRIDRYGRLSELEQAGWVVDYKHYQNLEPVGLPDNIAVTGHRIRVKLAVDEWDLAGG